MPWYPKYATTVARAHSVLRRHEPLHCLVTSLGCFISSTCGFNRLPRHIAPGKLRSMSEAKAILDGAK
jgi:hypothetical protein